LVVIDESGCTFEYGPFVIDNIVATEGPLTEGRLKVYPNPSDGQIFLEYEQLRISAEDIELLDLLGRRVAVPARKLGGRTKYSLDLRSLQAGLYYIRIKLDNSWVLRRVVIE